MSVGYLPQKAQEKWSKERVEQFINQVSDAFGVVARKPGLKFVVAKGRQLRIALPTETCPEDYWMVFRPLGFFARLRHNKDVFLHQSIWLAFLAEVKADKKKRPAFVYSVEDVAEMLERVKAVGTKLIFDTSRMAMKKTHEQNQSWLTTPVAKNISAMAAAAAIVVGTTVGVLGYFDGKNKEAITQALAPISKQLEGIQKTLDENEQATQTNTTMLGELKVSVAEVKTVSTITRDELTELKKGAPNAALNGQ